MKWASPGNLVPVFFGAVNLANETVKELVPREALKHATSGALRNMKAKISHREYHVTWYGHQAETAYAVARNGDEGDIHIRYQAIWDEPGLFQLICMSPDKATLQTPPLVSFFTSFRSGTKLVEK
jgi:uncharacterized protein YcfL